VVLDDVETATAKRNPFHLEIGTEFHSLWVEVFYPKKDVGVEEEWFDPDKSDISTTK